MKSVVILVLALVATPALAAEVDFSHPLLGLDGKPMKQCTAKTEECEKTMTLGDLSAIALSQSPPAEAGNRLGVSTPADEKLKRGQLALKIYGAGKLDLSAEDIALVKSAIGAVGEPVFVARAFALLDPKAKP